MKPHSCLILQRPFFWKRRFRQSGSATIRSGATAGRKQNPFPRISSITRILADQDRLSARHENHCPDYYVGHQLAGPRGLPPASGHFQLRFSAVCRPLQLCRVMDRSEKGAQSKPDPFLRGRFCTGAAADGVILGNEAACQDKNKDEQMKITVRGRRKAFIFLFRFYSSVAKIAAETFRNTFFARNTVTGSASISEKMNADQIKQILPDRLAADTKISGDST